MSTQHLRPCYYPCGICGAWHSAEWNGDCRQNDARFYSSELDQHHGADGWVEVPMSEVETDLTPSMFLPDRPQPAHVPRKRRSA